MLKDYETRAPRLIPGINQWILGKIKNDYNRIIYNEAFNEFVELLEKGENFLNAKITIQRKYEVSIEYDTIFPTNIYKKSTLEIRVG